MVAREDARVPALTAERPPGLVWSWSDALRGAVYAAPAALVAPSDVSHALGLALGVLPACLVGVAPTRRARARLVLVGVLAGIPILVGSILASEPVLAVLAIGAAYLASRAPVGALLLTISVPLVGVGLSYSDVGEGAAIAGLMMGGSIYAYLVSLLWPEGPAPAGAAPAVAARPTLPTRFMLWYGVRLGLAGGIAATIGFALDFDHVGWATAAAMLVMRPDPDLQRLRSVGRVVSVMSARSSARVSPGSPPPPGEGLTAS